MEYATFPLRNCAQTQGTNGAYSHQGTKAIDYGPLNNDQTVYAPFTGTIVFLGTYNTGNQIVIQSSEPVQKADGTTGYLSVMTAHDNDISTLSIGQTITQNTPYSKMGTAGYATGTHTHVEVINGPWEGIIQNSQGNWMCKNSIEPYKVLYKTTNTTVQNSEASYQTIPTQKQYIGTPIDRNTKQDQIEVVVELLNVRENPTTESPSIGYINPGIYHFLSKQQKESYTWYQTEYGWIAGTDQWVRVYPKEESNSCEKEKQDLQKQLSDSQEQIKNLNSQIEKLNQTIQELTNQTDHPQLIFTCNKKDKYYIELDIGNQLYFKA